MVDSISEGTLVEWTKSVGEAVAVDDVVAVIETDKVLIDIRTDFAGVITEQLASIDDALEVNAPLFKVDAAASAQSKPHRHHHQKQSNPNQRMEVFFLLCAIKNPSR